MRISKDLFKLAIENGLSDKEISDFFECKLGTVKTYKSRFNLNTKSKKLLDEDLNEFIELLNKGYTVREIADHFKCTKSMAEWFKNHHGLTKKIHKNVNIKKEELIRLIDLGFNNNKMAEKFKCDVKTITNYKRKFGLIKKINIDKGEFAGLILMGYTNDQLAKHFKCSTDPIKRKKIEYGFYSIRNPDHIYIVKLSFENEEFYKIGSCSNRNRFKGFNPYIVIKEILFIKVGQDKALLKEREMQIKNKTNSYIPIHKFKGHTECFSKIGMYDD